MLLEEQSDQGLHCLPFCLHLLDSLLCSKTILFQFWDNYSIFSGVRIFRVFTVSQQKVYGLAESLMVVLQTDNSINSVTVWHHEACQVMSKLSSET